MDFTIEFNSGGNHGHQLKDALGGLTIGLLYGLNYVHTPYDYLKYFAIGYGSPTVSVNDRRFKYKYIKKVSGPLWSGIEDYEEFRAYFDEKILPLDDDTLIVFEKAMRQFPFQTIPWYKNGLIKNNIFSLILNETSENFKRRNGQINKFKNDPLTVAIHINRGVDYDKQKFPHHFSSSYAVRYMFPMEYYENIMDQIERKFRKRNVWFHIYTEQLNSEGITKKFGNRKQTTIHVGSNRSQKNYELVHSIFKSFVDADILVCSNSSFSAMCCYFRKGKKTIYHPHFHLRHLPVPDFIATRENGDFNSALLD